MALNVFDMSEAQTHRAHCRQTGGNKGGSVTIRNKETIFKIDFFSRYFRFQFPYLKVDVTSITKISYKLYHIIARKKKISCAKGQKDYIE